MSRPPRHLRPSTGRTGLATPRDVPRGRGRERMERWKVYGPLPTSSSPAGPSPSCDHKPGTTRAAADPAHAFRRQTRRRPLALSLLPRRLDEEGHDGRGPLRRVGADGRGVEGVGGAEAVESLGSRVPPLRRDEAGGRAGAGKKQGGGKEVRAVAPPAGGISPRNHLNPRRTRNLVPRAGLEDQRTHRF